MWDLSWCDKSRLVLGRSCGWGKCPERSKRKTRVSHGKISIPGKFLSLTYHSAEYTSNFDPRGVTDDAFTWNFCGDHSLAKGLFLVGTLNATAVRGILVIMERAGIVNYMSIIMSVSTHFHTKLATGIHKNKFGTSIALTALPCSLGQPCFGGILEYVPSMAKETITM